jgi:hypothetical protein
LLSAFRFTSLRFYTALIHPETTVEPAMILTNLLSVGCLRRTVKWVFVFTCFAGPAFGTATPPDDEEFITGYLSSALEQRLDVRPNAYTIVVRDGTATITLLHADTNRIQEAQQALAEDAQRFQITLKVQSADELPSPRKWIHYPRSDLFLPLLADVKEPQFFLSLLQVDSDQASFLMASVGLGYTFGLYRWPGRQDGNGWQLGFFGAVFSQFNLDGESYPLLNSDFQVGFPLTFRSDTWSGRIRLYHQSSHLGDEFILQGEAPERINFSVEVLDVIVAKDVGNWRVYGGGAYLVNRDPAELKRTSFTLGADYRGSRPVLLGSRLVGGLQVTSIEERDWNTGTTLKVGLAFGPPYPRRRGTRVMLEGYRGVTPFGQFYSFDTNYYGVGVYFDL